MHYTLGGPRTRNLFAGYVFSFNTPIFFSYVNAKLVFNSNYCRIHKKTLFTGTEFRGFVP
jgi:hypothetical protein